MKKLLAIVLSAIMVVALASAAMAQEAPEMPEGYTQVKVFDGTYGFGDAEITAYTNDDLSAFLMNFVCFDEDQVLEGTVNDGIVTVTYDETGFMSGDAQLLWDDAVASDNPWIGDDTEKAPAEVVIDENSPFYLQGGIWESDFERANPNLNGLADDIND